MCLEVSAVIQEQRMVSWKFAEAFRSRELGVWSKGNEDRHFEARGHEVGCHFSIFNPFSSNQTMYDIHESSAKRAYGT